MPSVKPLEAQFTEAMRDQGSPCLGGKPKTPVTAIEVEGDRRLVWYQDTAVRSEGVEATAANVVAIRLEHGSKETYRLGREPCFTEAPLQLYAGVHRLRPPVLGI